LYYNIVFKYCNFVLFDKLFYCGYINRLAKALNTHMGNKILFLFYETGVLIESDDAGIIAAAKHNFSYFLCGNTACDAAIKIYHHGQTLPYSSLPAMESTAATPRNICYKYSGKTYIDYFGKAISVYDIKNNIFDIYTPDSELANEIIYLTVLSRVSELLDKKGMHRIHALGVEYNNKGNLILMPVGGGKTSLALALLKKNNKSIKLISEDSPLIKNYTLLPFPLRIGVRAETALEAKVPGNLLRKTKPLEHGGKTTIDVEYFSDFICRKAVAINAIFVGVRSTADNSVIKPISKLGIFKYCLMNSVVGVGLYQGMEFIMQNSGKEILRRFLLLFSRTVANIKIIFKAKTFYFIVGRDATRNAETFIDFLEKL